MKFRIWMGVLVAVVLVVGGLVFMGVHNNTKAADINGTANNVTGSNLTVGNKTLVIDGNTEIVGQLVSGSIVQIRARVQDDGTLLATRIVVRNNDDSCSDDCNDDDDIEGTIQSVGDNSIVINGHTILLDERTRIDDGHLAVNVRAEVEVVKQEDGSLLATKIEIEDEDDDNEEDDD